MFTIDQVDREALRVRFDTARALSIDIDAILRELQIQHTLREVRAGYGMTSEQYLQLQSRLGEAISDALRAQSGVRPLSQEENAIVYHYLLGAADLRAAMQRMGLFASMLRERLGGFRIDLEVDGNDARLVVRVGIDEEVRQRFAVYFCQQYLKLVESLAWMIERPIVLRAVDLPFRHTEGLASSAQRFACPVTYGNGATRYGHDAFVFHFDSALLDAPIVHSIADLESYFKMLPAVLSGQGEPDDFGQRVERILEKQCREIGGMPTAAELAAALNISVATLRRRLGESGNSYSQIKHDCQLRLGKEFLARPYKKLLEVAQRLGYRDANAFRRVFKKATGQTPVDYHKSCQRATPAGS
jgi:AraC-like DNA-binding protein